MSDESLRTSLFQRLTQFQLWLLLRIVWYAGITYLVTLVLFALLRLFTGVSVKRIGYFCLRHIVITPKQGVEVRIGKLGIIPHRPTVARPGFFSFIVANLEVHLDPSELAKSPKKKKKRSKCRTSSGIDFDLNDLSDGVPLLPHTDSKGFKILRWLVSHMKVFNLELQSTSIVVEGVNSTIFTSIALKLDLRKTLNTKLSNFVGTLDSYHLAGGEVPISAKLSFADVYTATSLEDEQPWQMFEDLRFELGGVLEVERLRVKEFVVKVHSGRFQLDVDYILQMVAQAKKLKSSSKSEESVASDIKEVISQVAGEVVPDEKVPEEKKSEEKESEEKEDATTPTDADSTNADSTNTHEASSMRMARILLQLVMRVQITIGVTEILRIPVSKSVDTAYLAMSMKDLNVDLSRMNSKSSGFRLCFDDDDYAHQAIFTLASFYAGIDTDGRQEEILYIPLVTSITRTNSFSQTVKLLTGQSQNRSLVQSRAVIYAPHLTLEERQFPNLIKLMLGIAARRQSSKAKKLAKSPSPSHHSKLSATALLPALDLEVVINDPATRIVCCQSKQCSSSIFVAASKRVQLGVGATHDRKTEQYEAQVQYEIHNMYVDYHSTNCDKISISQSKMTGLAFNVRTKPSLDVAVQFKQQAFVISALQHEVFHAIGQLNLAWKTAFEDWINRHPDFYRELREKRALKQQALREAEKEGRPGKPGVLRRMPKWLSKVECIIDDSSIAIASNRFRHKTNDILGVKIVSDKFYALYYQGEVMRTVEGAGLETESDGRHLSISANEFYIYKADKQLLSHEASELKEMTSHSIVEVPKLDVQVKTHTGNVSDISVRVEPRLKVRLNINLILAFSVLREITDLVLLRHLKASGEVDYEQLKKKPEISKTTERNNVHVVLPRALIKIDMPSDDQVMFELNHANISLKHASNPEVNAKAFRMYSEHPFNRNAWCILMSFVGMRTEIRRDVPVNEDKIRLDVSGVRINIPYKFQLYRIIDNGITLAKAIRTLVKQTANQDIEFVLKPHAVPGLPKIPRIHLKTDQFALSLEDDAFEAELALSMLTRRDVAAAERQKLFSFEQKIKMMIRKGIEKLSNEEDRERAKSLKHHSTFNLMKRKTRFDEKEDYKEPEKEDVTEFFLPKEVPKTDYQVEEPKEDPPAKDSKSGNSKTAKSKPKPTKKEVHDLPEDYVDQIAITLAHVSVSKLQGLLQDGLELGLPMDDHDPAFTDHHPWLGFWADPELRDFRRLRMPLQSGGIGKLSVSGTREALLRDFGRMWVDKIKDARLTQQLGVAKRRAAVFEDELDEGTCAEERIVDYSQVPLIMQLDFRKLDLVMERSHHETREELDKFLYEVGKGQPLGTDFSIFVPLYLDLKAHGGMRMDLRDYPLPVLHFPPLARNQDPHTHCALQINGNLIITEQLVTSMRSIRRLFVPLRPLPRELRHTKGSDVLEVNRTLTPIKTFTELKFKIESSNPTRVGWCMAYKPGFHALGEAFHGFSKPPIDPSPAVGFWDKIRLMFHARLDFDLPHSPLSMVMKAGRSPYSLQGDDSGFVFVWKDNTRVLVNSDDDPQNLLRINSDKFELLVPNYLNWESEFLHASPAERAFPRSNLNDKLDPPEKVVCSFDQSTVWKLGMAFERMDVKDNLMLRTQKFRDHHDIQLSMPEYIEESEEPYDAYRGFRSEFIHMAISAVSVNEPDDEDISESGEVPENGKAHRSTCHLTPRVLHHFKAWKNQFSTHNLPPIRSGKIYMAGNTRPNPPNRTFGTALSTATYQIALSPLDLSFFHGMRHRSQSEKYDRTSGVKAKMEDLVFDWHTRREPPETKDSTGNDVIELHGNRRWRMKSYLGQVVLRSVQARMIDARVRTTSSTAALHALDADDSDSDDDTHSTSDSSWTSSSGNSQEHGSSTSGSQYTARHGSYGPRYVGNDFWVDLDDYTDIGYWRQHRSRSPQVKVLPFLYIPQFVFMKRNDFSGIPTYKDTSTGHIMPKFQDMGVHECRLLHEQKSEVQNELLKGRMRHLQEQIGDLKASLESLQSSPQTAATVERAKETSTMVVIAETNAEILEKEIKHHENAEKFERDSSKHFLEEMRSKLNEQLGEYAPKPDSIVYKGQQNDWRLGNLEDRGVDDLMTFGNIYVAHAAHIQWTNSVRDLVFRLKSSLSNDKELKYIVSRRAVQYIEELVAKIEGGETTVTHQATVVDEPHSKPLDTFCKHIPLKMNKHHEVSRQITRDTVGSVTENTGSARLSHLYESIQAVDKDVHRLQKSHSVAFISPRIQLISDKQPDTSMQMTARSIEMQVVDVFSKFGTTESENSKIERRIGAAAAEAGFFVLAKEDVKQPAVAEICLERYSGTDDNDNTETDLLWPPWVSIELCYNTAAMQQFAVTPATSFGIQMYRPNTMHVVSTEEEEHQPDLKKEEPCGTAKEQAELKEDQSELPGIDQKTSQTLKYHARHQGSAMISSAIIDAPNLVVRLDREQFTAVYGICVDLLSYTDPTVKQRQDAVERIFLANDYREDYDRMINDVILMQKDVRNLQALHSQLYISSLCRQSYSKETQIHLIKLEREIFRRQTLLLVYMEALKATLRRRMDSGDDKLSKLSMLVDGLMFKILDDNGAPQLQLNLKNLHYSRLSNSGQGNINRATLDHVYTKNMMDGATYPHVLANFDDERYAEYGSHAVKARWTKLDRIGGIPILDNVDVKLKPLHIQVEKGMFDMLLDFVFPVKGKFKKDDKKKENSVVELEDLSDDSDVESDTYSIISGSESVQHRRPKLLKRLMSKRHIHHTSEGLDEMVDRASNYMSIRSFRIHPTMIVASYKGRSRHSLLNLQNIAIPLPLFEVNNRTWTKLDLIMRIKHMVVKTLVGQSGSIIGNKFKLHKSNTMQDALDLIPDRSQSGSDWKEVANLIDDAFATRETGAAKPEDLMHRHITLDPEHAKLLKPAHRHKAYVEEAEKVDEVQSLKAPSVKSSSLRAPSIRSQASTTPRKQASVSGHRTVTQQMAGSPRHLRQPEERPSPSRRDSIMEKLKKRL